MESCKNYLSLRPLFSTKKTILMFSDESNVIQCAVDEYTVLLGQVSQLAKSTNLGIVVFDENGTRLASVGMIIIGNSVCDNFRFINYRQFPNSFSEYPGISDIASLYINEIGLGELVIKLPETLHPLGYVVAGQFITDSANWSMSKAEESLQKPCLFQEPRRQDFIPFYELEDLVSSTEFIVRLFSGLKNQDINGLNFHRKIEVEIENNETEIKWAGLSDEGRKEDDFRQLFDHAHDAIIIFRPEGEIVLDVNQHASLVYGFTREEFIGLSLIDITVDPIAGAKHMAEFRKGQGTISMDSQQRTKEGRILDLEIKASTINYRGETAILTINRDITRRKEAERRLRESEALFRNLTENLTDVVWTMDINGKFLYISPSVLRHRGVSPEEAMIQKIGEVVTPESYKLVKDIAKKVKMRIMAGERPEPFTFDIEQVHKNGSKIWSEVLLNSVFDDSGNFLHFLGVSRDITIYRLTEEKLSRSETKYRYLIDHLHAGVLVYAADASIILSNQEASRILGKGLESLQGSSDSDGGWHFVDEERKHLTRDQCPAIQVLKTQTPISNRILGVVCEVSGDINWALVDAYPEYDASGNLIQVVVTLIDISWRKSAEDNLFKLNKRLNLATLAAGMGIWDWDIKSGAMEWDENMFKLLEIDQHNCTNYGDSWRQRVHPDDRESTLLAVEKAVQHDEELTIEFRIVLDDKSIRYLKGFATIIRDADESAIRMIGVNIDISTLKKTELEIMAARVKAEEVSLLKSRLMANLSHEIRTPLTGIMGFAEFLVSDLADETHRTMAENILQSGERLLHTLTGILDLSVAETQNPRDEYNVVNIARLVRQCADSAAMAVIAAGLILEVNDSDTTLTTVTNAVLVEKILNNLISNAIKFTREGTISLSYGKGTADNKSIVWITVKDTGIGIAQEHLGLIFDEFRQVSEGASRAFEGTGLGLHVSQRFAQMIGGTLAVESVLGQGSSFSLYLPLSPFPLVNDPEKSATPEKEFSDYSDLLFNRPKPYILLVEDDEPSAMVATSILEDSCRVVRVKSGEEAVDRANTLRFDGILMDINLGNGISGLTAVELIRLQQENKLVPIAAITANAFSHHRHEYLSRGCSHYLSKPFSRKELLVLIHQMLNPDIKKK
ncbi:MAG TPA: hypothetical protein DCR43_00100 [Bacteroidales bacterium]|nr:hypothetical protein [Bacteroidales bacterium]HBZ66535.1 hypothetical protein [Bacteroidales bacterium]